MDELTLDTDEGDTDLFVLNMTHFSRGDAMPEEDTAPMQFDHGEEAFLDSLLQGYEEPEPVGKAEPEAAWKAAPPDIFKPAWKRNEERADAAEPTPDGESALEDVVESEIPAAGAFMRRLTAPLLLAGLCCVTVFIVV